VTKKQTFTTWTLCVYLNWKVSSSSSKMHQNKLERLCLACFFRQDWSLSFPMSSQCPIMHISTIINGAQSEVKLAIFLTRNSVILKKLKKDKRSILLRQSENDEEKSFTTMAPAQSLSCRHLVRNLTAHFGPN
jgi:hypothetical protein